MKGTFKEETLKRWKEYLIMIYVQDVVSVFLLNVFESKDRKNLALFWRDFTVFREFL